MSEQDISPHSTENIIDLTTALNLWASLSSSEHLEVFRKLSRDDAEDLFLNISARDQSNLFIELNPREQRYWIKLLAPDDLADFIQELDPEVRIKAMQLLDSPTRIEVGALLAYREDQAGGLMNSRFARLRPDMSVDEAIRYLRAQTRTQVETIYYGYVLDKDQKLLGVVSVRQLFQAEGQKQIRDIMTSGEDIVTIHENEDQEVMGRIFSGREFLALPVINNHQQMVGIVTLDDVVDVLHEEATEDIHKLGGMQALDAPYFKIHLIDMIKKRGGWLLLLFFGSMFTATAMAHFETQLLQTVSLALFIPLIISSGGNSGSQASTLIIRAMALGEVHPKDLVRVFFRELATGLLLGLALGLIGYLRVTLFPPATAAFEKLSFAVSFSLLGIVLWGTLLGSMLPFILKALKLDPATASAPLVATIVDITGIMMYFYLASIFL